MTDDRRQMTDGRKLKLEVGMRPPASPSCRLYEPEAVGAIWAYAPEGSRKRGEVNFGACLKSLNL